MSYHEKPLTDKQKHAIMGDLVNAYRANRYVAVLRFEAVIGPEVVDSDIHKYSADPMVYIIDRLNADLVLQVASDLKPFGVTRYHMRPILSRPVKTGMRFDEIRKFILKLMDDNIADWEKSQANGRYIEIMVEELTGHRIGAYTYPLAIAREGEAVLTGAPTEV